MDWLKRIFSFHASDVSLIVCLLVFTISGIALFAFGNPSRSFTQSYSVDTLTQADTNFRDTILPVIVPNDHHGITNANRELSEDYVGPPDRGGMYTPKRRIPYGATLCLNSADSASLTLVPGIGPTFARRIVAFRTRLGGFYTVLQLQEVYGMTPDRYNSIKPFFRIDHLPHRVRIATLPYDSIPYHPYLSYKQHNALERILFRDGKLLGWEQLKTLDCFTREDSIRLSHYFIFQ